MSTARATIAIRHLLPVSLIGVGMLPELSFVFSGTGLGETVLNDAEAKGEAEAGRLGLVAVELCATAAAAVDNPINAVESSFLEGCGSATLVGENAPAPFRAWGFAHSAGLRSAVNISSADWNLRSRRFSRAFISTAETASGMRKSGRSSFGGRGGVCK